MQHSQLCHIFLSLLLYRGVQDHKYKLIYKTNLLLQTFIQTLPTRTKYMLISKNVNIHAVNLQILTEKEAATLSQR